MTASPRDDEHAATASSTFSSSPTEQANVELMMKGHIDDSDDRDHASDSNYGASERSHHRPNIVSSHSSFLSPYLSEPSSSTSASSTSYSASPATTLSTSTPRPKAPSRPPNTSTRSTMMRRRAALEDLCLGVEGVPVHRDMLNDFTNVVKRVFGTGMSMVSIMRDDLEMIGTSVDGMPLRSTFSNEKTLCPYLITSSHPRPQVIRDLDQCDSSIRRLPVWSRLVCAHAREKIGVHDNRDENTHIRFYAAVPLVIRWPGDCPPPDADDVPLETPTTPANGGHEHDNGGPSVFPTGSVTPDNQPRSKPPTHRDSIYSNSSQENRRSYQPTSSKDRKTPRSDLITLGTLCILDPEPRLNFSVEEEETLRQMGDLLVRLICTEQSEGWAMREVGGYKAIIDFLHRTALSDDMTFVHERIDQEPTGKIAERTTKALQSNFPATPVSENGSYSSLANGQGNDERYVIIPDDTEEKRHESELYDDAICAICDFIEDCAVVLLDVSQYRVYLKREEGSKEDLHQAIVDQDEPFLSSGYDIRPLANLLPGALQSSAKRDLVVKRIRRKREDGQSVGPRRLAAKVADLSFHSPFNQEEEIFSEGVGKLLRSMLLNDQYWYDNQDPSNTDDCTILKEVAPGANWILALPVWHSDGSPFKVLVVAWDHQPARRDETERFVRGIVAGTSAAMTIRKARLLEKAQATFSKVQAHELRTPLHQIKNIAALLRTAVTDGVPRSNLLTAIKDIEVASHRLEMVTNNILSYFEVQSDGGETKESQQAIAQREMTENNTSRTLEVMLADLVEALVSTDTNTRRQDEDVQPEIEIIVEIVPPFLGETVEEDRNGNLARAMGNIISNALAYIDQPKGFVHIVVDDVPSLLPPSGYADLSLKKNVSIQIQDSGIGMDREYLEYHYFRPMKKENALRSGSGLSVHIAQRLVNILGGNIAVSSQSGMGTTVHIEVPLMRRRMTQAITSTIEPRDPDNVASQIDESEAPRQVYLSGFFGEDRGTGLNHAGDALRRSVARYGCRAVEDPADADIVLKNVSIGNTINFGANREASFNGEVVLLFASEDQRDEVEEYSKKNHLRCFKRPIIPSVLRDVLFKEKEKIKSRQNIRDGQNPLSPGLREPPRSASLSSEKLRPALKHRASPPVHPSSASPILVVEDNPINRKILVQYLKKSWPVEQAIDGEQALAVFREIEGTCVVLLDINMPKLNGFETSIEMRRIEKEQGRKPSQIIAVTALSSEEHRSRGLNECGMNEWLVKPTNRQQIIDAVDAGQKAIRRHAA